MIMLISVFGLRLVAIATVFVLTQPLGNTAGVASARHESNRDKFGTTGYPPKDKGSQLPIYKEVTNPGSFEAERGGFECLPSLS